MRRVDREAGTKNARLSSAGPARPAVAGQEIFTRFAVIAKGDHLRADASLALLAALGVVWFVRRPLAE